MLHFLAADSLLGPACVCPPARGELPRQTASLRPASNVIECHLIYTLKPPVWYLELEQYYALLSEGEGEGLRLYALMT